MHKRLLALAAVLVLTAASTPSAGRQAFAVPGPPLAAFQETVDPQFLDLGDVYDTGLWQLSVPSAITGASLERAGWTEVRAAVTVLNTSPESIPFAYAPFVDDGVYPRLTVRDARGNVWPITRTAPLEGTMATSALHEIQPQLGARWTVGFQVPTINDDALELQVSVGGVVLASYDLLSPSTVTAWPVPNMERTRAGAPIEWVPGVTATARSVASRVCGDPDIETVTQIIAVTMNVENDNSFDVFWPGVDLPAQPAIAQWRDGTAARFSVETFVNAASEPLDRFSGKHVVLPSGSTSQRAFVFATPRDGRLGSVSDLPAGLYLQRPGFDGFDEAGLPVTVLPDPLWLDLQGAEATLQLSPRFCDLGFAPDPVPYAYMPSAKYAVGGEALPTDVLLLDQRARALLTDSLAAASFYYDGRGATLADADVGEISVLAPAVPMLEKAADSEFTTGVGIVYIDFDPDDPDFIFLMTQSASGTWLCTGTTAFTSQFTGTGLPEEITQTCFPEAFVEPATTTTTTTSTSTTTTTTTAAP